MSFVNRRQFLYVTAGAGAALGLGTAVWRARHGAGVPQSRPQVGPTGSAEGWHTATRSSRALGTEVSMTVLHRQPEIADAAIDAAFDALELTEELMSIYRPHSQLSRLNRDGVLDDPHPHLLEVLRYAQSISESSRGAFDVTVQPLWSLYAEASRSGTLPDDDAMDAARQRVDWRRVEVKDRQIRLRGEGTAITLNGIAQGYAADAAMQALRSYGVVHALVNTGEIGALGEKENGEPWTVGIQHPRRQDAYLSLTKLAGRCLATSGDYATAFSDDFRLNHVFDPETGRSPQTLASVSVAAPTAMAADALSTAIFVLGPEEGVELIRVLPQTDVLLVMKDGRTLSTPDFPVVTG